MNRARFEFHGNLNDFLPKKRRHTIITREFSWRGSIKDMIESMNVPHPEIELILVGECSVDFDHIVGDGEHIAVYPMHHTCTLRPQLQLRPPLTDKPRFILDTHLGRLAAYLRMAGFDTLYRNDYPDDVLAQVAHDEERVLLTRDLGLLKRSVVTYGYFVRATNPQRRLVEITERYQLGDYTDGVAFGRCTRCNSKLNAVEKTQVAGHLRATTLANYDSFFQCQMCSQIYWKGSHYERMQALLQEALNKAG